MNENMKRSIEKLRGLIRRTPKKIKIVTATLVLLTAAALVLTFVLTKNSKEWTVLFPGMTVEEAADVCRELQEMNAEMKLGSDGEIKVKNSDWDYIVYKLAEKGYPQSTPSYGIYFDNLSMTMSESEKKAALGFALQDRIQATIKRIDGVRNAVVTVNIPEHRNYIWKDNNDKATASVVLTIDYNKKFGADQIAAVKNIVAFSTQQILPEDVSVVDASTGKELNESLVYDKYSSYDRENIIAYSEIIKEQYEKNAVRILSPLYDSEKITAVAYVSFEYDKINEEVKQLIPESKEEKDASLQSHPSENISENDELSDIITDPDKTDEVDLPDKNSDEQAVRSDSQPDTGYILTQTEKSQGNIVTASISVVVPSVAGHISEEEKAEIILLVKNATGIEADNISVSASAVESSDEPNADPPAEMKLMTFVSEYYIYIIAVIAAVLVIFAASVMFVRISSLRRIASLKAENEALLADVRRLIKDGHNKEKEREMHAFADEQENAVKFARTNPQQAAGLIRSLMNKK